MKIDQNLTWDLHVDHVMKKITSGIFALRKMSLFCDVETLKLIYFSLIQSHIVFGIRLYGATTKINLDKILIAQKKAVRVMLRLNWRDTARDGFIALGLMTVYNLYIFEILVYFNNMQLPIRETKLPHRHNTRNRNLIILEQPNLELYKKKPSYAAQRFYCKLPIHIKSETDATKFKNNLKMYLVKNPIYSFEEYFSILEN